MAKKQNKKKYTSAQKKAYYMGYGLGLSGGDPTILIDNRQGQGQREDLCNSARQGYAKGKKNAYGVPFAKGYKKYPVSNKEWLKGDIKPTTKKVAVKKIPKSKENKLPYMELGNAKYYDNPNVDGVFDTRLFISESEYKAYKK